MESERTKEWIRVTLRRREKGNVCIRAWKYGDGGSEEECVTS
jgi:hypothetical protein